MFPPVYLAAADGAETHIDGGTKAPFLFRPWMIESGAKQEDVWAVANTAITLRHPGGPVGANTTSVLARTVSEMLRTLTVRTIYQIYATARNDRAGFHLAYIGDDEPETNPIKFDPVEMKRLFDYGARLGLSGAAWSDEPPRLAKAERIGAKR